ncbi:glycosyltransferase N-terminal domain-containing protein [Pedobacter aquatilis]|uniref:3-deoxy-D-manno-octulosonic acid transferase n=1 Tax=Pedobacter aquatilis TaxID=351343 RepID=UPI0025B3C6A4|nr:glycosyltransferase N-terminal domain-containing protein [Pedobacter aquatilis]MDN3587026.1 glycosyltransferase N-terminal domain-containing protein [Pedobacter aquatilis]
MLLLYTSGIKFYSLIIWIFSYFNKKAALFISGRQQIFSKIADKVNPHDENIWFHFASLGEFEQGRPVLEKIKAFSPQKKIIITFFSPSGYEIRKNYALADAIFYLPMDTKSNAKKFIELIKPEMAIFTKYEFWHFYFSELNKNNIPLYLISGIFRPNQIFFKNYGGFYRNMLKSVMHFFVQNEESKNLLNSIGVSATTISGDTRFDRVYENAAQPKQLPSIKQFCENAKTLICGSTWPEDEKLIADLATKYQNWRFIIAPHEVDENHIQNIERLFEKSIRFSNLENAASLKSNILIIDNIGMLSSLYQYGRIAYIGGGFGAGIHNTLEAAAFGLPVIFGPKYDKFQEAKDLIKIDAAKSISTKEELFAAFEYFMANQKSSAAAKNYVLESKGATEIILAKILKV